MPFWLHMSMWFLWVFCFILCFADETGLSFTLWTFFTIFWVCWNIWG